MAPSRLTSERDCEIMAAMKKTMMLCAVVATCCTALAETAQLRILWGDVKKPSRTELRTVEMSRLDGSGCRITVPKAEIPADATCVDVVPPFMTAEKGDEGWWMQARGTEFSGRDPNGVVVFGWKMRCFSQLSHF